MLCRRWWCRQHSNRIQRRRRHKEENTVRWWWWLLEQRSATTDDQLFVRLRRWVSQRDGLSPPDEVAVRRGPVWGSSRPGGPSPGAGTRRAVHRDVVPSLQSVPAAVRQPTSRRQRHQTGTLHRRRHECRRHHGPAENHFRSICPLPTQLMKAALLVRVLKDNNPI